MNRRLQLTEFRRPTVCIEAKGRGLQTSRNSGKQQQVTGAEYRSWRNELCTAVGIWPLMF